MPIDPQCPDRMQHVILDEIQTLAVGLVAGVLGTTLSASLGFLRRLDIPSPVIGGLIMSLIIAGLRSYGAIEIEFATALSDFFLLMFFVTVGLSAKLSALRAGGKPLLILCAVTVLMIVVQNILGVGVALGFGAEPFYGMLVGSISLVGGPGTAAAWANEAQAAGLVHAPEVAVAGATLAVLAGAVVAGPITGWIVRREKLTSAMAKGNAPWVDPKEPSTKPSEALLPVDQVMRTVLLIIVAVLIGASMNTWARAHDMVLPGFLTAMLAGVMITNLADVLRMDLAFAPIERNGQIALQAFLAMYLMSLKLWTLGAAITPLMVNVLLQIIITAGVAYFVLFRMLGRDYDAALTAGGFIGFGLSSMAVGMATMDKLVQRHGPSPKAFLLITLAGSFFVDLANAFVVQLFLLLPIFR